MKPIDDTTTLAELEQHLRAHDLMCTATILAASDWDADYDSPIGASRIVVVVTDRVLLQGAGRGSSLAEAARSALDNYLAVKRGRL